MKFSVLMSLYAKESPAYLSQALASLAESTVVPDEIIVVLDGPVGDDLRTVLDEYSKTLPMRQVPLNQNVGLGPALNEGLAACRNEWVARFDTDDINAPERFETQLAFIRENPDVDIVGGWISEFADQPDETTGMRRLPTSHEEIVGFARRRCPFNHMTVMFRQSKITACGGYGSERRGQDYALWVRILQAGARAANIPACLVHVRAGSDMVKRRGGWRYAMMEYQAQKGFYRSGFISWPRFALNVLQRFPTRLVPGYVRGLLYRLFLRRSVGGHHPGD